MTKDEKIEFVKDLTEKFRQKPNFLVIDTGGLSVAKINALRRKCFEANVEIKVVKNTLIEKALSNQDRDYSSVFPHLKHNSTVLFANETVNASAKLLQEFRGKEEKPTLKVAYAEESLFVGDAQLDTLAKLKSREDLIGEVIGLLQSPMQNLLGALQSGGTTIMGVLKTLEEKKS